jgi:predicted dehydrogenase
MINVGVIGAGHLGKLILHQLNELPEWFHVVGFYDNDKNIGSNEPPLKQWTAFEDYISLIKASEALILSVPTPFHFFYAKQVLSLGKHLFIEKPITDTLEEALRLKEYLHGTNGIIVQIGHIERFNPAWIALKDVIINPMFIEVHRLAPFNPRGTDVSVVLDLMIHDLDLINQLIPHDISEIRANGVAILSQEPDIANARIEFSNGAVANVTASRFSMKKMRKMRLFQKDSYISLDFLKKKTDILNQSLTTPEISVPPTSNYNALKEELRSFAEAIYYKRNPVVTMDDGIKALELAYQIIHQISLQKGRS